MIIWKVFVFLRGQASAYYQTLLFSSSYSDKSIFKTNRYHFDPDLSGVRARSPRSVGGTESEPGFDTSFTALAELGIFCGKRIRQPDPPILHLRRIKVLLPRAVVLGGGVVVPEAGLHDLALPVAGTVLIAIHSSETFDGGISGRPQFPASTTFPSGNSETRRCSVVFTEGNEGWISGIVEVRGAR